MIEMHFCNGGWVTCDGLCSECADQDRSRLVYGTSPFSIHTTGTEALKVDGLRGLKEAMEIRTLDEMSDYVIDRLAELPLELQKKKELAIAVGALVGACKVHVKDVLVRCGKCKYWDKDEKQCLDEIGYGRKWEAEDFCSHAEKRV